MRGAGSVHVLIVTKDSLTRKSISSTWLKNTELLLLKHVAFAINLSHRGIVNLRGISGGCILVYQYIIVNLVVIFQMNGLSSKDTPLMSKLPLKTHFDANFMLLFLSFCNCLILTVWVIFALILITHREVESILKYELVFDSKRNGHLQKLHSPTALPYG